MMNPDMAQYLGVFLDEGQEQLELLEANVLKMEREDHSKAMLQILFRAAHTLKGSSRAMGFLAIGDLTHEMENILDDLRNDKLAVETPIVNALLDCLDALGALMQAVAASGADTGVVDKDIPALVARLGVLRSGAPASQTLSVPVFSPQISSTESVRNVDQQATVTSEQAAGVLEAVAPVPLRPTEFEAIAVAEARETGLNIDHILIKLHPECLMKSVRVLMVMAALEPIASVLAASPTAEAMESDDFGEEFQLLCATEKSLEEIEGILQKISEVTEIKAVPWTGDLAPAPIDAHTEVPPERPCASPAAVAFAEPESKADPKLPPAQAAAPTHHAQTIRVDVTRLDNLLNLVGEMVIDRTQIARVGLELHTRYPGDDLVSGLIDATNRIARISGELQDEIMKTRMLPIDGVFQRLPRMVRDLAQKTGKEIAFEMFGGETELDRSVLEVLADPLIHLLRNSVDHGIESPEQRLSAGKERMGSVTLSAGNEDNHIVITITDDGGGIDPVKIKETAIKKCVITEEAAVRMTDRDALSLIFGSGFSTAKAVSDISGRGVGMDIVKSNLEKLGGRIDLASEVGRGSTFTIHLPLTLAIVRAILVSCGECTYVLPLGSVIEMLRLGAGEFQPHTAHGQATIILRGKTVPLVNLADVLNGDPDATSASRIAKNAYVVIIGHGEKPVGLCVDGLAGEQEVVIKSLGMLLGDIPGISGATILGDGKVAIIVDAGKAIERTRQLGVSKEDKALSRVSRKAWSGLPV